MEILFSFGAIADVQCGDLNDRLSPTLPNRYYRNALGCLRDAVRFWNKRSRAPSFVLQLGDVIDGFNILRGGKQQAEKVLSNVLNECHSFKGQFHHAWGNHELYNFNRLELFNSELFSGKAYLKDSHPHVYRQVLSAAKALESQRASSKRSSRNEELIIPKNLSKSFTFLDESVPLYYDFTPHVGFRFVLLDTFEMSTLGYSSEQSSEVTNALNILRTHNPNDDLRLDEGLQDLEKRFVSYNGGISNKQLDWLRGVLSKAKQRQEKVILFGHVPICPEASVSDCLVWNYKDVLAILRSSGCVVATFFGHTHKYRHHTDEAGIHHIVLPGVVECLPGTNGFATFDVSAGCMKMSGVGEVPDVTLRFRTNKCSSLDLH